MHPAAPVRELDRACDFVRAGCEPFYQCALFDRNTSQDAGKDLAIGTVYGDRALTVASAGSYSGPSASLPRLVPLFQATADRADFYPDFSVTSYNHRTK